MPRSPDDYSQTPFNNHTKIVAIRVGLIKRHPRAQRAARPKKWHEKTGKLDGAKMRIPVVCPDGKGGYFVLIGGHRTEAALGRFGPECLVRCELLPEMTDREANEVFLSETERLEPGSLVKHERKVGAERPDGLFVQRELEKMPNVRTVQTLYTLLAKHGPAILPKATDAVNRLWPKRPHVPGSVVAGIAEALSAGTTLEQMKARRYVKQGPEALLAAAKLKQARSGGKGTFAVHVAAILGGARA